jgi:hypothetical protein
MRRGWSQHIKEKKITYKRPPKTVVITPSDKSKRLIALDSTRYVDIVNKATIETGNYQSLSKVNHPRTEQINFNGKLNKVANKYKTTDPALYKALKANICSEPMPCPVYCLPKDHKEGELKGRPIHSATDTPATSLSQYLARSLNKLFHHVPAHLKNSQEFISSLNNIDGDKVHGFCSLDVNNLYGSIPLEDVNSKTPGAFTVAKRFFGEHKIECKLRSLSDEDFETLIRLSITSDSSGVASSISEVDIFIYSCFAQLISFEIDCFYGLRTRIYEYVHPTYRLWRRH